MSTPEKVESFDLLPNRLAIVDFSAAEVDTIIGGNEDERELLKSNFNWIAAYLCEEVGIFESEIPDWFNSEAKGLDHQSPLSVWRTKDGFWRVFEYAQEYKRQVDEALGDEKPANIEKPRSHQIAQNALGIIIKGFEVAGVDITPTEIEPEYTRSRTIHNPDKVDGLTVRWKGNRNAEDYRVTIKDGPRTSSYFIVRYFPTDSEPMILQTGIGRYSEIDKPEFMDIDTDLDGRPPSIGEVASFVVPLANEVKNRSLALMS